MTPPTRFTAEQIEVEIQLHLRDETRAMLRQASADAKRVENRDQALAQFRANLEFKVKWHAGFRASEDTELARLAVSQHHDMSRYFAELLAEFDRLLAERGGGEG
jgi:hypothetical protein